MNYLADTHTLLWTLFSPERISGKVRHALSDPQATNHVSALSFWEISLKYSLNKLDLKSASPDELPLVAKEAGFKILSLEADLASTSHKLPIIKNKDPFDRMLAWQAIKNDYVLLTKDKGFAGYEEFGLKTIW